MAKSTVKGTKIKLDRSDIIIRTIGYVVVTPVSYTHLTLPTIA